MENVTANGSFLNTASENKSDTVIYVFSNVIFLSSLVIILLEVVAVYVLQRCRRVPVCSRILSTSFLLSDAAGAIVFTVHQILISIFGINNDVILNSRMLAVGIMMTISWGSIAFISLERVIAIKLNIRYNVYTSTLKIYLLVIFHWIIIIVIVVVAIVIGLHYHCHFEFDVCDLWTACRLGRFVMMGLLFIYESILVVSYVIIHGVASRHERNRLVPNMKSCAQSRNIPESLTILQYAATKAILKIVLAFLLLHTPIAIHLVYFETHTYLRTNRNRQIFHAVSYMCIQINSFVSMYLYVAKIDECKLKFYLMLSRILKRYKTIAEELRIKVYDIVVYAKASKPTHSNSVSYQSQLNN